MAHDQAKANMEGKTVILEEGYSSGEEVSKVTPAREEDNPELGDGNPESGNCHLESGNRHPESGNRNPDLGNRNPGKENDRQGEEPIPLDVNMAIMIPAEFCAPTEDIAELALGAERVMFKNLENLSAHMKPLFIRGHLDGTPIGHMPLSLFKKLSHVKGDLKRTYLSLSSFAGDLTEAK
jgi:hypothetical protein